MHVRVFLARYRGYALCPECGGARLRKEALYVRVGGKNLGEIVQMNIAEAQNFFLALELDPGRGRHRRQDPRRDPPAAEIPERRRPRIPHARPPFRHAFRRRGAAHPTRDLARLAAGRRLLCARRAFHRTAQPRHRPPHPHPGRTARAGQHDRRGRARSRRDARLGPHRRPGTRSRRARRQDRFRRPHDDAAGRRQPLADRASTCAAICASPPGASGARWTRARSCASPARACTT